MSIIIGIDPGKNNGFAVYDSNTKRLIQLNTYKTWEVIERIDLDNKFMDFTVYIEDPTTWKPFGGKATTASNARIKGAGSVTARFQVIVEYMEDNDIKFFKTKIQGNLKKMDKDSFNRLTGWDGKSTEHSRDAALIVWGR